jgi:hypothetical protein
MLGPDGRVQYIIVTTPPRRSARSLRVQSPPPKSRRTSQANRSPPRPGSSVLSSRSRGSMSSRWRSKTSSNWSDSPYSRPPARGAAFSLVRSPNYDDAKAIRRECATPHWVSAPRG